MQIGIVGLPNVGKSTLFNALTKKGVLAANYPFATIDPSVGIVAVPDERLDLLSKFSNSKKTVPAVIEFVDIAGLVAGASKGEGLGNKFLANIREVDAILEVVRVFEDKDIIHVENKVNPTHDVTVINMELMLADLETVEKRIGTNSRDAKRGDKDAVLLEAALQKVKKALEEEKMANTVELLDAELPLVAQLNLLTMKPILYALNISEASENVEFKAPGLSVMIDPVFEKGLGELITKSYELLGLQTFLTTGEDETRAWTTKIGASAPQAGASIHTDFEKKFIRAQVINWQDLLDSGSLSNARAKGLLRTEGKEYIVQDGDIIEFLV